jgi:hypothetical protein
MIIENKKEKHTFAKLTKDLPEELQKFGQIVEKLKFEEKPDYKKLKKLLM